MLRYKNQGHFPCYHPSPTVRFVSGREHPFLRCPGQYLLPLAWDRQFIDRLHNIMHKQWIYRNYFIHFKEKDGLTIPEHHDIINGVENYTLSDPDTLLPCHCFLFEADLRILPAGLHPIGSFGWQLADGHLNSRLVLSKTENTHSSGFNILFASQDNLFLL